MSTICLPVFAQYQSVADRRTDGRDKKWLLRGTCTSSLGNMECSAWYSDLSVLGG